MMATGCLTAPPGLDIDASPPGPDAGDGDAGNGGNAALVFQWRSLPTPEGEVGDNMSLKEVRLPLRDVRAIGDSAPGDERTSVATLDLRWKDGVAPRPLAFSTAPPGLYSRFEFSVQSPNNDGYVLQGEVTPHGTTTRWKYEIHDKQALPISLDLGNLALDVGEIEMLEITVDLGAVLEVVDWSVFAPPDGRVEIDEDDPQMGAIRAKLASAFSVKVLTGP
jgi:hypothetical protein